VEPTNWLLADSIASARNHRFIDDGVYRPVTWPVDAIYIVTFLSRQGKTESRDLPSLEM
jgi:hypothetical protein